MLLYIILYMYYYSRLVYFKRTHYYYYYYSHLELFNFTLHLLYVAVLGFEPGSPGPTAERSTPELSWVPVV
jgi:hypothetical protein